jgi:HAD superfamily hydrolase (TIGR01509 family)
MTVKALIFDVDGTLAETEEIHRAAFNQTFAEAGLAWSWTQELYGRLLRVTGGRERIAAYARECGMRGLDIATLHRRKTDIFNDALRRDPISLRPGVEQLLRAARAHDLRLAIATTTSRPNVINLLGATLGSNALAWFTSLRTGEDVAHKKPDPEVYLHVLADLGLRAGDCIAFEDSENGLRAAQAADIRTIITPSLYTRHERFDGAARILADMTGFALPTAQPAT